MKQFSEGEYLKLYRKIINWEWYTDVNTFKLFIHCLIQANWKAGRFLGVEIPSGSFASSIGSLANETGLTISQVRTSIKKLKNSGELTSKSQGKFTVFTVENWNLYQSDDTQNRTQVSTRMTFESQQSNKIRSIRSNNRPNTLEEDMEWARRMDEREALEKNGKLDQN